jgi:hypothetical protein
MVTRTSRVCPGAIFTLSVDRVRMRSMPFPEPEVQPGDAVIAAADRTSKVSKDARDEKDGIYTVPF